MKLEIQNNLKLEIHPLKVEIWNSKLFAIWNLKFKIQNSKFDQLETWNSKLFWNLKFETWNYKFLIQNCIHSYYCHSYSDSCIHLEFQGCYFVKFLNLLLDIHLVIHCIHPFHLITHISPTNSRINQSETS